jgi:hypothetical protein
MSRRDELPRDVTHLADAVVERSALRGARRARLAADLREHLEDALLDGRSPDAIAATFGDPALVAALVRRSPPSSTGTRRLWRALAGGALVAASLYGASAVRLGTFAREPALRFGMATAADDGHAVVHAARLAAARADSAALRAWFHASVRTPANEPDSLARALRIARAIKGVRSRTLGARLLEPVYFARVSSVDDLWPVALAAARRLPMSVAHPQPH